MHDSELQLRQPLQADFEGSRTDQVQLSWLVSKKTTVKDTTTNAALRDVKLSNHDFRSFLFLREVAESTLEEYTTPPSPLFRRQWGNARK